MSEHTLTRKELATLLDVSVQAVARNEKRLGLDAARSDINTRVVRYRRELTLSILTKKGLVGRK